MTGWLLFVTPGVNNSFRHRWLWGALINMAFLAIGSGLATERRTFDDAGHFSQENVMAEGIYYGLAETRPDEDRPLWSFRVKVLGAITDEAGYTRTAGRIWLNVRRDTVSPVPGYGDLLIFVTRPEPAREPDNPFLFDQKRYLLNQDVGYIGWVEAGAWRKTGLGGNPLIRKAVDINSMLGEKLRIYGITGDELGLASAILLGTREGLDRDLMQSYSAAGLIHILSVSGLHVGVIYLALNFLFFFTRRFPGWKGFKAPAILAGIWAYAFITGLSPSVMRASFMFSIMLIGAGLRRANNIFNSLAAAAFLLMVLDPLIITRAGFQLSFMAVLGIACFERRLRDLWKPKAWLPEKIWPLATVSLAAQLGTLPLSLYYFQSFPVYFLPANLVVIPLSSLVIYLGVGLYAADQLRLFPELVAEMFQHALKAMNGCVRFFESLPGSVIRPVWIDDLTLALMLLALVSLFMAWGRANARNIMALLLICTLLAGATALRQARVSVQRKLVVYKVRDHTMIDLVSGRYCLCLFDTSFTDILEKERYISAPNRVAMGIRRQEHLPVAVGRLPSAPDQSGSQLTNAKGRQLADGHGLFFFPFAGRTFCIAPGSVSLPASSPAVSVDYAVIGGGLRASPKVFLQTVHAGCVVLEPDVARWRAEEWKKVCSASGLRLHDIREKGAFTESW
jgi:competence protein ComEC